MDFEFCTSADNRISQVIFNPIFVIFFHRYDASLRSVPPPDYGVPKLHYFED